jgi:hypothetical protein
MGALPEVVATDVAVRAQVAVDLVNFGVQDSYDNIALHLFVSALRPNIPDEVMRQSPITLTEAKAYASDAEKRATIPQSKTSTPPISPKPKPNSSLLLRKLKNPRIAKSLC